MAESPRVMVYPNPSPSDTPARRSGSGRERGFTLIEMMVTVAIAAVLAAIAYPSYREHIIRSQAGEGTAALADGRHRMEQYFLGKQTYVGGYCETSLTVSSFTVVCPASGTGKPDTSSYIIKATGSGATAGLVYTIDQNGTQRTTAVPSGWITVPTGGHACWLLRKGATC